jgi:HD-GYP domain-containing protein (c-di-GMP phosphodiesterase class II)
MNVHRAGRTGKPYVAIAVGEPMQRSRVVGYLMSFHYCIEYRDIPQAMAGCRGQLPLLALVSEHLSGRSGFDLVRMLRLDPDLAGIPVVMIVANDDKPTRHRFAQCGAESHLVDPYSRSALITTVSGLLNHGIERKWKTLRPLQRRAPTETLQLFNGISDVISDGRPILYPAVSDACQPVVEAVANDDFRGMLHGVRDHDNYSYAHSVRVATYLALFGFNLRLSKDEQVLLASGGLLHDTGKMSIPYEVLNKPGRLNAPELAAMKGHVAASVSYLLGCHDLPQGIITIAAQHHEKLDGTGYPNGLAANQLNRLARIASIIDVFSALTDRRAYKPPMEAETALTLMAEEMASHLDIKLLAMFREMLLDAARDPPSAG